MVKATYSRGICRAAERMSRKGRNTYRSFANTYVKPDPRYWNGNKDNGNIKVMKKGEVTCTDKT